MRRLFLPLGLAAISIQPVLAQSAAADARPPAQVGDTSPQVAEPAGPLALEAAVELALRANPALAAAAREVAAGDGAVLQAGFLPNPELAALVEDTRRETRTAALVLNQPIQLGGKRAARVRAAEGAREVAAAELAATRAQVRAGVIGAFFDVVIAQEGARLAAESVALAQRATTAAAKRVAAGKVSPVEETRARVAEAGVAVEAARAASALRAARSRLAAFWGNAMPRFERAEGEMVLPAPQAYSDLAARLDAAPVLRRAGAEVARRRAVVALERARRIPDLTVSVGVQRDEDLGRNQAIVGLSVPLPLFDRNQGNLAEALARADQARDELAASRIRLASEAAQAWERLETARWEAEELAREALPGAQRALDAATKGFELGKFDFLLVLDAQRTLFQARSQHLRSLAEAHRARAELDRILGGPEQLSPGRPKTVAHPLGGLPRSGGGTYEEGSTVPAARHELE
ncbi:cobalt-zinc-cadmium resistance protein [Azoarcus sp. DD4]|uniref:TolC family protein n=1 Tax=Azoarcus sp. DD4 TaxID=2027405 RepID=UPI00112A0382|nr:TolC family protein [Azoarcus sp. DD4]QDF96995.1 cobalt-zinc-cadmium resistance protein [Azoarcus sp. DD4]